MTLNPFCRKLVSDGKDVFMELNESREMYLETIQILSRKQNNVRAIDVGRFMGYSKPSVSNAMRKLREGGYIDVDGNGHITLTESGEKIADEIYDRHKELKKFLISLGVTSEVAERDACRIEHVVSEETMEAIKKRV